MDGRRREQKAAGVETPGQPDGRFRPVGQLYRIRVKGHLNSHWTGRFEGFAISHQDDGTTLLTGVIADQPALHGLITKIRDLGLPLLSVARVGKEGGSWSG